MPDEKKKKVVKYLFAAPFAIFFAVILISFIVSQVTPSRLSGDGWKVESQQSYARNGKKCMGYRVYIDHRADNSELKEIYKTVTDDSYYLHTVWFYLKESSADGSDSAWRTMEEDIKGRVPNPD